MSACANHRWRLVTHSCETFGPPISGGRTTRGMVDQRRVWTPAIAPSGLAVASGKAAQWRGRLFAGGLVSGDVREGPDGFLYVLTDGAGDGELIRLERG